MALHYHIRGVSFPGRLPDRANVDPFQEINQPRHIGSLVQTVVFKLAVEFQRERDEAKAAYDAHGDHAAYEAAVAAIYDREVLLLGRDRKPFKTLACVEG